MGGVLAQGERRRFAGPSALLDRGPQRRHEGGKILRIEPRAGRARHELAAAAAYRFWALVGGELFSPGQRGTGTGPLRSSRLALCPSPFLPDATEPLVLCSRPAEIRRRDRPRRSAGTLDHGTSPAGDQHVAAGRSAATDKNRTSRKGVSQTAILPKARRPGTALAHENEKGPLESPRHRRRPHQIVPSSIVRLSRHLCCYVHEVFVTAARKVALSN